MKLILSLALTTLLAASAVAQIPAPTAPTLAEALKTKTSSALMFQPTRIHSTHKLTVHHIRMGDGSVRPNERGAMLVIYNAKPNGAGGHDVLFQDFHFFTAQGSPVLNFDDFVPGRDAQSAIDSDNRVGIIAILIGLIRDPRTGDYRPIPLPSNDVVSCGITDGTSVPLLLPAVQKVRAAASRL